MTEQEPPRKIRRNLFANECMLMGQLPWAPTRHISDAGNLWTTFDLQVHKVGPDSDYVKGESFRILCKAWGHTAQKMVERCPRFAHVLLMGGLAPDVYSTKQIQLLSRDGHRDAGKNYSRGVLCFHVSFARIIRKPARKDEKTMRVPKDEYRRLKSMERHFDPKGEWLDPEVARRYDLGDDEFDDLLTEGVDPC